MNDLDYLNQISAKPTVKKPVLLDKKMKIIFGILAGVILVFIILLATSSGSNSSEKQVATATSELKRLYTRTSELSKALTKYNSNASKPSLRSTGTSFSAIMTETVAYTKKYLEDKGIKSSAITPSKKDAEFIEELNTSLEEGRLSGSEIFDRTYASEMYYQIRYLVIMEESVIKKTTDSQLKTYLENSKESVTRLAESFRNFSDSN